MDLEVHPKSEDTKNNPNTRYALQMSLYQYLLEKAGFEVGDRYLVQITPNDIKIIPVRYLKNEVEMMINER